MRKLLFAAALAALPFFATSGKPAHAIITFIDNPGDLCGPAGLGGGCETNVLFQAKETGANITGQVGHTGAQVLFDTLSLQDLDQTAEGNADIFCLNTPGFAACPSAAGGLTDLLTSLEMKAGTDANGNPTAWGDVLLNMQNGIGSALITVQDQLGNTFTDPLKKGQNFLGLVAGKDANGVQEVITDIKITDAAGGTAGVFGFEEFKQPRVSGVCVLQGANCQAIETPEPASLAILGVSLIGLGFVRARRRA